MPEQSIIIEQNNGVLSLQLNRPDKKNAVTQEMYQSLADGINAANNDDSVRVIVIKGHDHAFCAGNDLSDFVKHPPEHQDSPVWQFLHSLNDNQKPLICGLNGPAVGVGTTLLLHCDLVVASKSSLFSMPFTALGLCPEAASSLLLPQQVGLKKANEWLLLGKRFGADEALSAGLINQVVENADGVREVCDGWASAISELPPESIQVTRKLLRSGNSEPTKERMIEEGEHFKRLLKSEAAQTAFAKFLNR